MNPISRRSLLGLGAGLAVGLRASAQEAPAPSGPLLVYAVRHAEKAGDEGARDPELSAAGKARAKELARVLADVPLQAVYSTNTIRTRSTGKLVAAEKKLEIKSYAPGRFARKLKRQAGKTVLVVGHSNTVPHLLRGLGARFPTRILGGYDDLFLAIVLPGQTLLQRLHYGAAPGARSGPTSRPH